MKLKKTIVFLLCFTMMFLAAACGSTTADGPEDYYQEDAAVTGSGYEYTTSVDTSEAVTIQILNPDGEDTVMAELTFTEEDLAELDDA